MRLYHGTSYASAERILAEGVSFSVTRRSDPGDLGWGFYLTGSKERAKAYGPAVISLEIDTSSLARVDNPYFVDKGQPIDPVSDSERLFFRHAFSDDGQRMLTVQGHESERVAAAKAVRKAFLEAGYQGIVSRYQGVEVVLFTSEPIGAIVRPIGRTGPS